MKVTLKQNWDVPLYPPVCKNSDQGNFVGREKEILPLIDDIQRKKSGSILVSGYRGVGKTSLVYKALSEVEKNQKNTIFVFLNGTQLIDDNEIEYKNGNNNGSIDKRKILENIIRRLYSTIEENDNDKKDIETDTSEKIKKLYRKTMAKEYRILETNSKNHKISRGIEKKETLEFSQNENDLKILIISCSFIFASIIQFTDIIPNEFLNKVIPLLLTFHIPFSLKYVSKLEKKHKEEEAKKSQEEEIYQFDNNVGSLEFDLENIHRGLSSNNKKLIYVIDELDKIPTEKVKIIFNYFKNLFTLSDAQFIFICGEELYNEIYGINNAKTNRLKENTNRSKEDTYRPKEYTYFTSKFFLSRPTSQDLDKFFENIVEEIKIEEEEEKINFEFLKKSLLFESKNDFYDLKTYIRSRITNFEDGKPIIEYSNLDKKDVTKARLQEAICILFDQKYMSIRSSKWRENEEILRELFIYAHKIFNSPSNTEFTDPTDLQNFEAVNDAKIDFNKLLQRCGAFGLLENKKREENGKLIRTYRYIGEIQSKIPLRLEGRSEFEEKFVCLYEEYFDYVASILNSYKIHQNDEKLVAKEFISSVELRREVNGLANRFRFNPDEIFESYGKIYEILVQHDTLNAKNINRDEIEERNQELINKINILIQSLPKIIGKIIQTLYPNLKIDISNPQKGNLLEKMPQNIRETLLSNNDRYILFNQDFSKQILLITGKEEILDKIKNQLFTDIQGYIFVCFTDRLIDHKNEISYKENIYFITKKSPKALEESIVHLLDVIPSFLEAEVTK